MLLLILIRLYCNCQRDKSEFSSFSIPAQTGRGPPLSEVKTAGASFDTPAEYISVDVCIGWRERIVPRAFFVLFSSPMVNPDEDSLPVTDMNHGFTQGFFKNGWIMRAISSVITAA